MPPFLMTGKSDSRSRITLQPFEPAESVTSLAQQDLIRRCQKQLVKSPRRAMLGEIPAERLLPNCRTKGDDKNHEKLDLRVGSKRNLKVATDDNNARSKTRQSLDKNAWNNHGRVSSGTHMSRQEAAVEQDKDRSNSASELAEGDKKIINTIEWKRASSTGKAKPVVGTWSEGRNYKSVKHSDKMQMSSLCKKDGPSKTQRSQTVFVEQIKEWATTNSPTLITSVDCGGFKSIERCSMEINYNNKFAKKYPSREDLFQDELSSELSESSGNSRTSSFTSHVSLSSTTGPKNQSRDRKKSRKLWETDKLQSNMRLSENTNRHGSSKPNQGKNNVKSELNHPEQRIKKSNRPLLSNQSADKNICDKNNKISDLRQQSATARKSLLQTRNTRCSTLSKSRMEITENDKSTPTAVHSVINIPNVFARLYNSQKNCREKTKLDKSAQKIGVHNTKDDVSLSSNRFDKNTSSASLGEKVANKRVKCSKRRAAKRQDSTSDDQKIGHITSPVLLVDYTPRDSQTVNLAKGEPVCKESLKKSKENKQTRGHLMRVYEYNLRGHRKNIIVVGYRHRRAKQKVIRTKSQPKARARHFRRSSVNMNLWRTRAASPATITRLWRWVDKNRQLRQKEKLASEFGFWNTGPNQLPAVTNCPQGSLAIMNRSAASWKAAPAHVWCPTPLVEEEEEEETEDDAANTSEPSLISANFDSHSTLCLSLSCNARKPSRAQSSAVKNSNEESRAQDCFDCRTAANVKEKEEKIDELQKSRMYLSTRPKNRLLHLSPARVEKWPSKRVRHNLSRESAAPLWALDISKGKQSAKSQRAQNPHARHKKQVMGRERSTEVYQPNKDTSMNKSVANTSARSLASSAKRRKKRKIPVNVSISSKRLSSVGLYATALAECQQVTERLRECSSLTKSDELVIEHSAGDSLTLNRSETHNSKASHKRRRQRKTRKRSSKDSLKCQGAVLSDLKGEFAKCSSNNGNPTASTCKPQHDPASVKMQADRTISKHTTTRHLTSVCKVSRATTGFTSASDSRLKYPAALTRLSPALPSHTSELCSYGGDKSLSSLSLVSESKDVSTLSSFEKSSLTEENKNFLGMPVVRFGSSLSKRFRPT